MPVTSVWQISSQKNKTFFLNTIDLNCDMGEGLANDALLMPYISSANIACGYHAGDTDTMKRTVALALEHHVCIGAHPGFADKINFGRNAMHVSPAEIYRLVTEQVYALQKIATEMGAKMTHVKPHGALYNMSAKDEQLAATIAHAVSDVDTRLILFGLSGSVSISEANKKGLRTANEVFADRTYQDDGTLTSRTQSNAMIETSEASAEQVLQMVNTKTVTSVTGKPIAIHAETICLHGDGEYAVTFAKYLSRTLQQNHIGIKAF